MLKALAPSRRRRGTAVMKKFKSVGLLAIVIGLPALAFAQLPGEPKPPPAYDITGDAQYRFKLWAPDERVRQAQRVLPTKGYYQGPTRWSHVAGDAASGLELPEVRGISTLRSPRRPDDNRARPGGAPEEGRVGVSSRVRTERVPIRDGRRTLARSARPASAVAPGRRRLTVRPRPGGRRERGGTRPGRGTFQLGAPPRSCR